MSLVKNVHALYHIIAMLSIWRLELVRAIPSFPTHHLPFWEHFALNDVSSEARTIARGAVLRRSVRESRLRQGELHQPCATPDLLGKGIDQLRFAAQLDARLPDYPQRRE